MQILREKIDINDRQGLGKCSDQEELLSEQGFLWANEEALEEDKGHAGTTS